MGHHGEGRYYGAFYDEGEVNRHHAGGRHEYLISGTAIKADVFINLPKLKTHKKTGVTLSLKNLVGVNGDKNWLPHHTAGDPSTGGDQFPGPSVKRSIERRAGNLLRKFAVQFPLAGSWILARARRHGAGFFGDTESVVRSGNWHGNDTTWRMALDLNALLLYGFPDGTLRRDGVKKPYLSFVDGILAGDGNGPLNPDPVPAGLVALGTDPADVDTVCAWLMGFDPENIPVIREAYAAGEFPISSGSWRDAIIRSAYAPWNGKIASLPRSECNTFHPHFGWIGAIERTRD